MLGPAIRKDLLLLARDRGAVIGLFLMPIVFIAVFGAILGGADRGEPVRLAVWHAPGDARGARIAGALADTGMFRIQPAGSADAARRAAGDGDVVGLVIPPDLDPEAGRAVELVIDEAAAPQVRGPIEVAVAQAVARELLGPPPPIYARLVTVTGPPGVRAAPPGPISGFALTVPGNAVLFGFFLALQVALSFVEERRSGTFRRILASPASRWRLLVAKLVPYVLVGVVQFAFLFGVGCGVFGLAIAGSVVALAALAIATVLSATALGLAIASLGGTEKQVAGVGALGLIVLGLAGGAIVPRVMMPDLWLTLSLATPHAWALDGFLDVLVRPGTGVADVAPHLAALLGFTAVFGAFGAVMFRFEK